MVKVEKIPSIKCEKCGSFQVILTDNGPECDECNKFVNYDESDAKFLGIDMSEDLENLTISRRDR